MEFWDDFSPVSACFRAKEGIAKKLIKNKIYNAIT